MALQKLTDKDIASFPHYVNKWLDIGLGIRPTNRALTEENVVKAYEVAGLQPPGEFKWFLSPHAGQQYVKNTLKCENSVPIYGQFDASWLSFYDFFAECESVDIPIIKKLFPLMEIAKNCGWWWAFDKIAVMTERHVEIHRDAANRLHAEEGMAIRYADDWGVYAWHGYRIPTSHHWIIKDKSKLTPKKVNDEGNAELRRIMAEIYGFGNLLRDTKARELAHDVDGKGNPRRLLEMRIGDQPVRIVEVHNSSLEPDGTRRVFHLGAMPGNTPHEAIARSFGFNPTVFKEEACS